jgi:hypothetical protein
MIDYPLSRPLHERKQIPDQRENGRFHNRYLSCYQRLARAQADLLETEAVFRSPRVWPDQCQEAIDLFTDLQNACANLSDLLDETAALPEKVRHQRYPILLSIGQVHAECCQIISCLVELPCLNIKTSRGRGKYEEIRDHLKSIQSNLNELIETLQVERLNPLLSSGRGRPS